MNAEQLAAKQLELTQGALADAIRIGERLQARVDIYLTALGTITEGGPPLGDDEVRPVTLADYAEARRVAREAIEAGEKAGLA